MTDQDQQDLGEGAEVDADAGHDGHAATAGRRAGLGRCARRPASTWAWVRPAGRLLADDAVEDDVGRVAQDLAGRGRRTMTLTTARAMTTTMRGPSGRSRPSSRRNDAAEVLGLRRRACPSCRPASGRARRRPAARRRRPTPGGGPPGRRHPCRAVRSCRLASSAVSWERRSRGRSRTSPSARGACRCRRRRPSSRTTIWSALRIVPTRWATMMTVGVDELLGERRAQPRVGPEVERREAVVEDVDVGRA